MKYYCEQCDRNVDDNGPYEKPDGEYMCQDCMESAEARAEAQYDDHVDMQIDEAKLRRADENNKTSR